MQSGRDDALALQPEGRSVRNRPGARDGRAAAQEIRRTNDRLYDQAFGAQRWDLHPDRSRFDVF
ncbi:MAG: hypothetical protein EDS66_11390 [Planctomycetota bacterium]|nr:MAG: hypothetical protein EDS66_11390 [Planctomycetota bacterium]MCQ3921794.1 hypothetical protein [Planctomycetota bacterium]